MNMIAQDYCDILWWDINNIARSQNFFPYIIEIKHVIVAKT